MQKLGKLGAVFILVSILILPLAHLDSIAEAGSNEGAKPGLKEEIHADKKSGQTKKKPRKSRSYADVIRGRGVKPVAPPRKKPKYKEWSEVTRDATIKEGLFKVYTKREDVYFEIKKEQLDKPLLAVLSLSKGIGTHNILGGLPIDDIMFDFHRVQDHVQLRRLNTLFRASDNPELQKAIDLTFGNSILLSLDIESENESTGALLVEVNDVFLSDLPDLAYFMRLSLKRAVRLDKERSVFGTIKTFPKNVEIEVKMTYSPIDRAGLSLPSVPDSRYMEIGIHYSINMLPAVPMQPRLADDRLGYFLTPFKDFTRDDKDSYIVHYIDRWRLEKKDSTAALSEPKKPIVFYIDSTVPLKYREFVKAGVEEWQKAFEEAGFKNAITAVDAPDDPGFDPEDARYNAIRWIVSDSPSFGAIGPPRVDPRTGEILDADVLIDGNLLAGFRKSYQRYAGPDEVMRLDPFLRFIENPFEKMDGDPLAAFYKNNNYGCTIGQTFPEEGAFMRLALLAGGELESGMQVPVEYIGEALKAVTMHEVGHALGLRHNFKSSTATPYDELNNRAEIEKIGMTGSVMDYAPPNVSRDRSKQGYYYTPTVGLCDKWMIKWGYSQVPGNTPVERDKVLKPIAEEAWKSEYAFGADEDTYPAGALDPLCNIWDLGDDPLRFAADRMAIAEDLLKSGKLEGRVVENGDDYAALRSAVVTLFVQEYIAERLAVKYIGGQYTTRSHKGDPGGKLPFEPVPAGVQRKAMEFLIKHAFSPDAFELSPELLNKLIDPKLLDWENNPFTFGRRFDFPLITWVNNMQYSILVNLMQPFLLQRIVDAEYKVDHPYTLSEYFQSLTKAIWTDNTVASGRTASMRRNLQRNYLRQLVRLVVQPYSGTPEDAVALARLHLLRIRSRIDEAFKTKGLSEEANAHLLEAKARIDRALEAKLESGF
jgi:hypothetical protein